MLTVIPPPLIVPVNFSPPPPDSMRWLRVYQFRSLSVVITPPRHRIDFQKSHSPSVLFLPQDCGGSPFSSSLRSPLSDGLRRRSCLLLSVAPFLSGSVRGTDFTRICLLFPCPSPSQSAHIGVRQILDSQSLSLRSRSVSLSRDFLVAPICNRACVYFLIFLLYKILDPSTNNL